MVRSDCATWLHKARELPKEQFRREVEQELTGKESEPWEIIYFKVYKSQIPVIEQARETAALMLGSDKSRGYCLDVLLHAFSRSFQFLRADQRQAFRKTIDEECSDTRVTETEYGAASW